MIRAGIALRIHGLIRCQRLKNMVASRAWPVAALAAAASTTSASAMATALLPAIATHTDGRPVEAPAETIPAESRRPLWEIGFGGAALSVPDYRGSDRRTRYLLPLPFVIYRGEFLRSDRDGARAVFVETSRVEVDLSVSGSAPARSDGNGVRAGMADLPATFEVGPNFNVTLWQTPNTRKDEGTRLDVRLPARLAITLQNPPRSIGWVVTPQLNLDLPEQLPLPGGGWNLGLATGPLFGSRRFHQHFYGVRANEAVNTPLLNRPAYEARSGYGGWQFTAALSRRFERFWAGGFVRWDRLNGAAYAGSPLLRRQSSVSAGFGMAWVFAQSATQIDTRAQESRSGAQWQE